MTNWSRREIFAALPLLLAASRLAGGDERQTLPLKFTISMRCRCAMPAA